MSDRYVVRVADRCGVYDSRESETFSRMVLDYFELTKLYERREGTFVFANVERADVDTNGLTEREEYALEWILPKWQKICQSGGESMSFWRDLLARKLQR